MMTYARCDTPFLPYLADSLHLEQLTVERSTMHHADVAERDGIRINGHHEGNTVEAQGKEENSDIH